MFDLLFVVGFVALPVVAWVLSRSVTWTAVALVFGFAVAGNAVQSLIALGVDWNVRGLQGLVLAVMIVVAVVAGFARRGAGSMRRQVLLIGVPSVVIGLFLIAMRLMAPDSPGPLTAVGYLINHPQAEDNAKWLHLAAQLADGRAIEFSGYAGGPLLLLMSMVAALISVLSMILLGGVNEVAVAVNTVVGTQFLLIALVPFGLAPWVERRVSLRGNRRAFVPGPAVVVSAFVLFVASSVVTSFGHLSLQFVLLLLVLWSSTFLTRVPGQARLLTTLAVVGAASVWIPLNVLGLGLVVGAFVWTIRGRDWWGLGATALTLAAVWDALISSTLFLLGIQIGSPEGGTSAVSGESTLPGPSVQTSLDAQIETAKSLFTAPGGVEQVQPMVGALALGVVVLCVWLLSGGRGPQRAVWARFAPIVVLSAYLVAIQIADAIATGGAPHYGGHKLAFALTIMALVSALPLAIAGLDRGRAGMTPARWAAVGGVVVLLTLDTMLPRALSALSPMLWPAVDAGNPPYWSAFEVRDQAEQSTSSLPIACAFAPPQAALPTALPLGQQSYNCTRMLLGMTGLESDAAVLVDWLRTDWLSNESHWDDFHGRLVSRAGEIGGRSIVLMNEDGGVAGFTTLGQLTDRYVPVP